MSKGTHSAIIVDNSVSNIELIEGSISFADPDTRCVSFVFGDEAVDTINNDFKHPPDYIFLDANLKRIPVSTCLRRLRSNEKLADCCITVFSSVMPEAVSAIYLSLGADFAFTTPSTPARGRELIADIMARNPHIDSGARQNSVLA